MRILHVLTYLSTSGGGPPASVASLAREQARRGHQVEVFACRSRPGHMVLQPGVDGNLLVHEPVTTAKLVLPNRATRQAIRRVSRGQDIIHIHGTWRYHALAAGRAAQELGIPYIVKPAGNLGRATRRHHGLVKLPYFLLLELPVFRRATAIHYCSRKEQKEAPRAMIPTRSFVVPEPVNMDLSAVKPDLSLVYSLCPNVRESDRVILYLGRICFVKRLEILLEAFIRLCADFHDTHLIIAGPPEDKAIDSRLRQRVENAGLTGSVSMPGMVLDEKKAAILARADIFAQPSLHENFGISVAEALMFGLPCVVSDGVALGDEIAEYQAGIVTPSSVECFASALGELLADSHRRAGCARAATQLAKLFAPDAICDQMDAEYQRCIEEYASASH